MVYFLVCGKIHYFRNNVRLTTTGTPMFVGDHYSLLEKVVHYIIIY